MVICTVSTSAKKGGEINLKYVRSLSLILLTVLISSSFVFAGAPAPTTERPYPVKTEIVSQPVAPKAPVAPKTPASEKVSPLIISKHFTWGLGLGGNPLIGFVEKDQYGYPRTEYGLCTGIGFAMTWFKGQPSAEEIKAASNKVKANNPGVDDKDIPSLVRKELGITSLSYVGLGILNAEIGTEWILSDSMRTRLGFGLPTLISFGVNFDF